MKFTNWMTGMCAAAVVAAAGTSFADEAQQAAKKIFTDNQEAVVSVSAVLKLEKGDKSQEKDLNMFGTVLDEKGLTVVSATMLDPLSAVSDAVKEAAGADFPKSTTSKIKIMLADGTEIPARTVYQDPDLDIAFLMPEKTDKPLPAFAHITPAATPDADVLDRLVSLQRLPKQLDRKAAVGFCDVVAKLTKPRTVYLVEGFTGQPGMPVFTEKGTTLGVMAVRKQDGGSMGGGALQVGGTPVVLPMKYILQGMEQARAAKVEEKKEEPKAEEKKDAPAAE
jgi:hypothetical protein